MTPKLLVAVTLLLAAAMVAFAVDCPPGTSMVNENCVPNCLVPNCAVCDPADLAHTDCATCYPGYELSPSKKCTPMCTIANCKTCSSSGNNACQECDTGYARTAKGLCKRTGNSASIATPVAIASTVLAASLIAVAA
ncbi:surface antigen-like protein [Leishmania tarentolae]|uniref:Surface antigen-like protein n=1 Tax=Leishmania tarentolae TaxID=5689 RepID=A0A640K8K4_LEITA|nr:surface antigen-like protein [Leishmania tarentolae]GET85733.1 surface antigen-like protein [Leishmania tarentolae]